MRLRVTNYLIYNSVVTEVISFVSFERKLAVAEYSSQLPEKIRRRRNV